MWIEERVTNSTNRRKWGPATSKWYSKDAVGMHAYDGHACAVFAEVNVVSDEPRLVRLDEVDQPFHALLELFERPARTSEVST